VRQYCVPDFPESDIVATSHSCEIDHLLHLSRRIGRDPLLTQASSGNTSVKLGGQLWIKRSGAWLANATGPGTLLGLKLDTLRADLCSSAEFKEVGVWREGEFLRASVETAMHAVLPQRVVVHVHSVNTIAWAVRTDGLELIRERLAGLCWTWIPYVASGVPLARAIERALAIGPATTVFVLANHGLVLCGETCREVEALLADVENRLAIAPRDFDSASRKIIDGGILFPCQAIFLVPIATAVSANGPGATQRAVLQGLLDIVRRIPEDARIRYLSASEVKALLTEDAHRYRLSSETNAPSEMEPMPTIAESPVSEIWTR
jgi:ribulose-5-phosphate 4-epimerase/fuculose-1-phosphate aldolase